MSFRLDEAVVFYVIFLSFYVLFISLGGFNLLGMTNTELIAPNLQAPESPNILEAVWFALSYVIENIVYYINLSLNNSTILFVNLLLIIPMTAVIGMWVLKIIRGTA